MADEDDVDAANDDELKDLRQALTKERSLRKKAEAKLAKLPEDFDLGTLPGLLEEVDGLRKNKGKVPEDIAAEWAQKEKKLRDGYDKQLSDEKGTNVKLRGALHKSAAETKVRAALEKADAHVDIMLPHVMGRIRMVDGEDGLPVAKVVDHDGTVLLTTGRGTGERTIEEEVGEFAKNASWAMGFKAEGLAGSGAGAQSPAAPGIRRGPKTAARVPMAEIDVEAMARGEQSPAEWPEPSE